MRQFPTKSIFLVVSLILLASIPVTTLTPSRAPQSQGDDFPEFSTYNLFTGPDSIDCRPEVLQQLADAIRKAQAPGNCSLGRLKIRVPAGDPIFQKAVVGARRDAVLSALNQLGVPVAGRLFVETAVFGDGTGHDTIYEPPLDKKAPKLDVIWTPEKGTPVKAGQQITAKATASDHPAPWQTGLKNIKLTVDGGERPFGFEEYQQDCERPALPQTLERFYIVPRPEPSMVRLRATARDYAGNETEVWADFPTGPGTPFPERAGCKMVHGSITYYQGIGGKCTGTLFVCGESFPAACNPNWFDRPSAVMSSETGPKICCDDWRKARQSKKPCDVSFDADCDGIPNSKDRAPSYKGNERPPQTRKADPFLQP